MSKKGTYVGIGIAIIVIVIVFFYTNIFELVKPSVDQSVVSTKEAISNVEGKDVVSGVETISSGIQNETSKIEITNPFP